MFDPENDDDAINEQIHFEEESNNVDDSDFHTPEPDYDDFFDDTDDDDFGDDYDDEPFYDDDYDDDYDEDELDCDNF